ncbi:fatty acid desaturase [Dactylosporangium sp. NPDC049742]|uniref:fatty acid desaturase family protein n=1 Tax=Dactylosporangium sp. NPDC049742 TaxID=3154737 RepID=UPI00342FBA29
MTENNEHTGRPARSGASPRPSRRRTHGCTPCPQTRSPNSPPQPTTPDAPKPANPPRAPTCPTGLAATGIPDPAIPARATQTTVPGHHGDLTGSAEHDTAATFVMLHGPAGEPGGWLVDLALGGLNYQIEHHLFPGMPRPNLRRAQPLVRSFCQQHDVSYCETTLLRSYAQTLHHLHHAGRPLRTTSAT